MQEGCTDSLGSTGPDHESIPLQRCPSVLEPVQTICQAPSGVLCGGVVPLDTGGQGDPGEGSEASGEGLKAMSGLKTQSYEDRLVELRLPSLQERLREIDMVQTYKLINDEDGDVFFMRADERRPQERRRAETI